MLLGLTSVFAAFGLTAVSSQFIPTGESTQILMMLIGMAVGVDYSLFYLKREREERARGAGKLAALEAAAATSGHAVLVSGLTVMASLAGMFFMGDAEGGAHGVGSILVVGVAVLGSLTVLPGRAREARRPRPQEPPARCCGACKREERDSRVWGFVLGHVMRRPRRRARRRRRRARRCSRCPATRHAHQVRPASTTSPASAFPVLKTYDHIQAAFPAERSRAPRSSSRPTNVTRRPCRPASPTFERQGARHRQGRSARSTDRDQP